MLFSYFVTECRGGIRPVEAGKTHPPVARSGGKQILFLQKNQAVGLYRPADFLRRKGGADELVIIRNVHPVEAGIAQRRRGYAHVNLRCAGFPEHTHDAK